MDTYNKRARNLVRKLNKIRHEQAKKIDILCNDMVSAHKDFVGHLNTLTFTVGFYESLLGQDDLSALLNNAAETIKSSLDSSNVSIFLTGSEDFDVCLCDSQIPEELNFEQIAQCFTGEVLNELCRARHACSLDDMLAMGLQANPAVFGKLAIAAVPLPTQVSAQGFILIWRSAENPFSPEQLERITSAAGGLCKAITLCRKNTQIAEA